MTGRTSLTAESWVAAAYTVFSTDGLRAVRVEVLARNLGTTKGSFYWHFTSRAELISQVMLQWEQEETNQLIDLSRRGASPRERLLLLYRSVGSTEGRRRGEARLYADAALEPADVAAHVFRVTERRVSYVAAILAEAGIEHDEARRRASISLATAIGFDQLALLPAEPAHSAGRRDAAGADLAIVSAVEMALRR